MMNFVNIDGVCIFLTVPLRNNAVANFGMSTEI